MPVSRLVPPEDWPTLGLEALAWMETYLCHGPGDVQGTPLEFDDEFAQIVCDLYRLYPPDHPRAGRRVVREAGVSMAKGRAKSEFAGALCCFEFIGPCRFSSWGDDGPTGRPVTYPFIRPLATEEGQTGNTYGNVMVMLNHALEHHRKELRLDALDVGATRTYLGKNGQDGEIRPSTSGAASKDGGKESFCVADEPHLYVLPELRQMYRTTRRNSQKRNNPNIANDAQSWMLNTTTMFEPGQDSVAEELYEEAERLQKQERKSYGFCWHHREGFEVTDPDDDAAILESLAEAYGPAATVNSPTGHMDPETILEGEFHAAGSVWAECVRYFLNRKWQGENKAVDPLKWDDRADPSKNNILGKPVVLWFDGSDKGKGNDHTVLGAWTLDDTPHCVLIDAWEPEKQPDGEYRINRAKVRARVTQAKQELNVVLFVCDPHKWNEQIDDWSDEFGNYAPDKSRVVIFDTAKASVMGPAIDRLLEALDEKAFTHDGSRELRWYALNALLGPAKGSSNYHALFKEKHALKIDGYVGATLGFVWIPLAREVSQVPTFFGTWA